MPNMAEPTSLGVGDRMSLMLLGATMGAFGAMIALPWYLPDLTASLGEPNPKVYWFLARASGFAAYLLLWLAVVLGLLVSSKLSRAWPGGPMAVDLHQFLSLLSLGAILFHALILLGDHHLGYAPLHVFVPFASHPYRPLWVGLGQVGLYLAAIVAFSFYVRRYLGARTWRLLHYGSFAVYFLITAHALGAGTDTTAPTAIGLYSFSGLIIYFLIVYRLLISTRPAAVRHMR